MLYVSINSKQTQHLIWDDIKESFNDCGDIGFFDSSAICTDDIPRIIYKGKVVIPYSVLNKINKIRNKNSELYQFSIETLVIVAGLKLNLNEKFSIILGKCYSCIYGKRSTNDSSQFEQLFFSSKFIDEFGVEYQWDVKDKNLKKFIKTMFKTIMEWNRNTEKYQKDLAAFKKSL